MSYTVEITPTRIRAKMCAATGEIIVLASLTLFAYPLPSPYRLSVFNLVVSASLVRPSSAFNALSALLSG